MENIQEIELTESMISNFIDKLKASIEKYRIRRMKTQVLYDPKTYRMAAAVISPKETGYMILTSEGTLESHHKVSDKETMKVMDDLKKLGWKRLSRSTPTRVITYSLLFFTGSAIAGISLAPLAVGIHAALTGEMDAFGVSVKEVVESLGILLTTTVGGWIVATFGNNMAAKTLVGFDNNLGPEEIRKNTERNVMN